MKIVQFDVSQSDFQSAHIFFTALRSFYDLREVEVLDMFARNGQLTVTNYLEHVGAVDCWELMPEHRQALQAFKPREIKIGCSYLHLQEATRQYGMVVIDTPQGIHTDLLGHPHIEHFDVLRRIKPVLADRAIIVLYVNKAPYDRDTEGEHGYDTYASYDFKRWMHERQNFYHIDDGRHLTEEQALSAYRRILKLQGFDVCNVVSTPCYSDVPGKPPYAYRLALEVRR